MALATLHIAAIPLLAGLAAGTGAVATYVAAPDKATAPALSQNSQPCEAQTWPYIDRACVTASAAREQDRVRIVATPRPNDAFEARWTEVKPVSAEPNQPMSGPSAAAPAGLITSDGVLRQPQKVDAIPNAPAVAAPAREKRSEAKRPPKQNRGEARLTTQPYLVPAERSGETRQVYVTRPLRLDLFR
jgi:hypothetical protein